MKNVETYIGQLMTLVVAWGPRLLLAIATLIAGWWLVRWLVRLFGMALERNNVDISLRYFLRSLLDAALKVLLIISVASMIGIATTSFVAVLGAAGLAIGLALQGSLANFAGGVLILLLKPYRAGDYITAQGHSGTVREIQLFYTIIKTQDSRTVIIPNGKLSNDTVVNFSVDPRRCVEMRYEFAPGAERKVVRPLFVEAVAGDDRIMNEPPSQIIAVEHADGSLHITLMFWVQTADYEEVPAALQERVQAEIDKAGITVPFTRVDTQVSTHSGVPTRQLGLPADSTDLS